MFEVDLEIQTKHPHGILVIREGRAKIQDKLI